jgi:hypothetical protein
MLSLVISQLLTQKKACTEYLRRYTRDNLRRRGATGARRRRGQPPNNGTGVAAIDAIFRSRLRWRHANISTSSLSAQKTQWRCAFDGRLADASADGDAECACRMRCIAPAPPLARGVRSTVGVPAAFCRSRFH